MYNNISLFLLEDQVEDEANNGKYDSQSSQDCVEAKESRVDEYLLNHLRNTLWDTYTCEGKQSNTYMYMYNIFCLYR